MPEPIVTPAGLTLTPSHTVDWYWEAHIGGLYVSLLAVINAAHGTPRAWMADVGTDGGPDEIPTQAEALAWIDAMIAEIRVALAPDLAALRAVAEAAEVYRHSPIEELIRTGEALDVALAALPKEADRG